MSNNHRKPNTSTQPPPKTKPSPETTQEITKDEYKPKPYNHTYKEYRPTYETPKYKPYVGTQIEYKGNVEYKLTKENYYPMNHWKSQSVVSSTQPKVDITKKKVPVVPPKPITPPPPRKRPTPTPPPPKSPTPPPPKSPTPEPRRQPSPKPVPMILPTKGKETPPPPPPPLAREFNPETKYPPEVIACVQAYLMAHSHAPYKVTPTPEPFFVPPSSKDLPPEVEALLSAYYSLHSIQ